VFFLNWALIEHFISITGVLDLTPRYIPVKGCQTKHVTHISNSTDIPSRDSLIKCVSWNMYFMLATLLTFHPNISPLKRFMTYTNFISITPLVLSTVSVCHELISGKKPSSGHPKAQKGNSLPILS
jgi:hypothetical protein